MSIFLALALACSDKGSDSDADTGGTGTTTGLPTGNTGTTPTGTDTTGTTPTGTTDTTDTTTTVTNEHLEIAGSYTDNWGGDHSISDDTWSSYYGSSVYHITQFDNGTNWAVAQNDSMNAYFPDMWSRFDWTVDGSSQLWFCTTAYNAASEADALATAPPDTSDPAATGCGGFSWTMLIPAE